MQTEASTEFLPSVVTFCPVVAFRNHANITTLMLEPRWFTKVELTQKAPSAQPLGEPRKVMRFWKGAVGVTVEVVVAVSSTVETNAVVAVEVATNAETEVTVCSLTLPNK